MFNRGQTAVALHLDGKRALRAHLNGQVVWDGTRSAVVSIPLALAMVSALVPGIRADSSAPAPLIAVTATAFAPSATASSSVRPDARIQVTGYMFPPSATSTATIAAPLIMAEAVVLAPIVSEAFDRSIVVPRIDATATVFAPAIVGHYTAQVPLMVGSAEVLTPMITTTGAAAVNVPMIAVNVTAFAPSVTSTVAIAAPLMSASAALNVPELRRDGKITAPLITATGTAYVPNVQAINFKPAGMIKSADSNITSTTAALVTGMAANANLPGTTVTADAVISAFAGPVRAGFSIQLSSSSGTTGYAAIFKNGVQVGDTFSMTVPYKGASLIVGSAAFTVAVGDSISLRYWSASSYPVSVKATTTRLNVSAGDSVALGGAVSANYTPGDGWTDLPIVADSGTTLSGYGIVVPAAHPNAIVAAAAVISSGSAMALRFLVNGTVVHTGPTAPAYDVRMVAATGLALAAGDVVKCQVQRISTFGTTVSAGATLKIV